MPAARKCYNREKELKNGYLRLGALPNALENTRERLLKDESVKMSEHGKNRKMGTSWGRRSFLVALAVFALCIFIVQGAAALTPSEKDHVKQVVKKLKAKVLLSVQDYDKINPLDRPTAIGEGTAWKEVNSPKDDYDRQYTGRLKQYLGIELAIANSKQLNAEIAKSKQQDAERIAEKWIENAEAVIGGVKKNDVIRAAKLYLGLNKLVEKYDADALTMASWHLAGHAKEESVTNAMPPLSWVEFSKRNIPVGCESLLDCSVTQMVGTDLTNGRAGFLGDILNDWVDWSSLLKEGVKDPGNVVIIGHCGGPITPHGNDRVPYIIRDHVINGREFAKLFGPEETITAVTIKWPANEVVTILKFDVYSKRVFACTGKSLDGFSLYKNFSSTACRSKAVVKIDNPEAYKMFPLKFREQWGIHPVVFYGELTHKIREFAAQTGFEAVIK